MTSRISGFFVSLFVVMALSAASGSPQKTAAPGSVNDTIRLSLEDAIRRALETNEDVGIAAAELDKAKGTKKEATSAALPHLDIFASYTRNPLLPVIFFPDFDTGEPTGIKIGADNDYLMTVSVNQVLFAFGRVGGAIKAADYYLKSSEEGLEAAKKDVRLEAEIAYYDALLAVEVRRIAIQSLARAKNQFEETEKKLRQQTASRFDSIRAAVEIKNREPEVLNAENAIRLARLNLKRIVGIDRNTPVILTDSLVYEPETYSLDDAIEEAYQIRSDIRALRLNVAMTEKIYTVQKRGNFPTLSLFGNYTLQGQSQGYLLQVEQHANMASVGLSLNFPIFDGLATQGRAAQAKADHSAAQLSLQRLEKIVALALQELYDQLGAEQENLESQQATVQMAEESYRLALVRFQNGLSTRLELEDAELALTVARLNYTEAVYRYMVAKKRFEYAMGH
ncbi:MAG: TolC family protein [Candidatus Latescibacterota bacterium]|nr:MAG: TolC family protein [Candidatus Latescibacterota bacterium]